jgi:hypothetical protein
MLVSAFVVMPVIARRNGAFAARRNGAFAARRHGEPGQERRDAQSPE